MKPGIYTEHTKRNESLLNSVNFPELSDEQTWHFNRRLGIGGSDCAAILGISRFKTPHDIWLEKTGRAEPESQEHNQAIHFGNVLEETVAQEYARREGVKVRRKNQPIINESMPWFRVNIDRQIVGKNRPLECKTANAFTARHHWGDGCDDVPEEYLCQCQETMIAGNFMRCDLAVLIGGQDFRIYKLHHSKTLAKIIIDACEYFWFENVIKDIPPDPKTLKEINERYTKDTGSCVECNPEILQCVLKLQDAKRIMKDAEKIKEANEAAIKKFMGENSILTMNGQPKVTWKSQSSNRFDQKKFKEDHADLFEQYKSNSDSRVLRIKS